MKTIKNPTKKEWAKLMQRPAVEQEELFTLVNQIFAEIRKNGDKAVKKYSHFFDKVDLEKLEVSEKQLKESVKNVSKELQDAIKLAKSNIEKFHAAQQEKKQIIETTKGVKCWRENRAIEKVGIYIPGGSAPLFSTVLMLGLPAKLAGCQEIVLCTPPNKQGEINPAILFAAKLVGDIHRFSAGFSRMSSLMC
jgi:histidinol dehydrogenase